MEPSDSDLLEQRLLLAYEELADAIFRHCYFRLSNREQAKDFMQEVFLRAWEYLASGNEVENLRAFLYRIANNLIVDEYRRRKKKKDISLETLIEEGMQIPGNDDTQHKTEKGLQQRDIRQALDNIEEPYRTAIIMRFIDDMQPAEIAIALDISPNVVSVRIHRGLQKLRSLLPSG